MTQRQLDRAVLAGIGVLLLIILGLALSPAPTSAGDISDPAVRTPVAAEQDVSPDAVQEGGAEDALEGEENAEPPVIENDPVAGTEENTLPEAATPPADEPTPQTPAQPVVGISVERVGFAYATGSEGACSVPLTAWNYVAVSRDLLETYPCGTAVTLSFDDEIAGRSSVTAQVGDTM